MHLSCETYSPTTQNRPFTTAVRNKFARGGTASLKNSVVFVLYSLAATGGISTTELRSLNAMGIISNRDPEVAGVKLQQLITRDKVGVITIKDRGAKDYSE